MKIIYQHDQRDCGAACLAMISDYHGLKMPLSKFRELTKTDKLGTNIYGLVDGAKKIGLYAEALCGNYNELSDGIKKGNIHFPFIAHTVSDGEILHYVVVYKIEKNKIFIADPAKGRYSLLVQDFLNTWTGYIVTFTKTNEFKKGNYNKNNLFGFFKLLKGQYKKIAGILLISLLIAVISVIGTFIFEIAIDEFATDTGYYGEIDDGNDHTQEEIDDTSQESEAEAPEEIDDTSQESEAEAPEEIEHEEHEDNSILSLFSAFWDTVAGINFNAVFICLIALYIFQAVIQYARGYLIILMSKKIDLDLSLLYYNHIVDLPISSISLRQTGEYLSRLSDTDTIRQAISGATLSLLLDSFMVIACGVILYLQNNKLFFVSLIMVILYAIIVLYYRKPIEKSNREVMENNAQVQSFFKESIDGMETIKATCANQQIKNKTKEKYNIFSDSIFKNSIISLSQDTLADTVELIGTVVILWIGFSMVIAQQITIGSLITFYALLAFFTEPIKNLIGLQPAIQTAYVAAERLNDILDLQTEKTAASKGVLSNIEEWQFKNVDFRYGNRELTLKNINLSIKKGEKIAIVGESGSGKTTLAKLLLRFYEVEKGCILFNSTNISDENLLSIRKNIAYVDQNTFLFADTIKNNLKLGNPNISDADIEHACRISKADEFIKELPLGYDTPLEENGMNLSGGQRQRLAIARALLRKPQLLILDEATSNLDTITESSIKNTILKMDSEITFIIIAHRLTTIKNCTKIYVMEKGEIVESGDHEYLLNKGGKYTALWNMQ